MLLPIPNVLTAEQVTKARGICDHAQWTDGRVTAGHQSARAKDNMQLSEDSAAARELGEMVLTALGQNALFISAALPSRVFPPLFNRYAGGQSFGTHVDNSIREGPGTGARLASFFWIQSMVQDDAARPLLFDLDSAIQTLSPVQLTGIYHNLLRRWATP